MATKKKAAPKKKTVAAHKLTISNPTTTTRGLMLKKGVIMLPPGEVKVVPPEDEAEVRALFKVEAIMRQVDSGLLRFSDLEEDKPLIDQETPAPPAELTDSVQVGDTGLSVGANANRQFDPDSESKLAPAGTMTV